MHVVELRPASVLKLARLPPVCSGCALWNSDAASIRLLCEQMEGSIRKVCIYIYIYISP